MANPIYREVIARELAFSPRESYLAGLDNPSGWLVIFDRRTGAPPVEARTSVATAATPSGRQVTVIRA